MRNIKANFMYLAIFFCIFIIASQTHPIYGYEVLNSKLIIASSFNYCKETDWEVLKNYLNLVKQYLNEYNIKNKISSACVSLNDLNTIIKEKSSFDLIIIIPDTIESFKQRAILNEYGHYSLLNNGNHIIVSQTLSKDPLNKESIWILSHELSHFALQWYDYPKEMVVNQVHEIDALYNLCLEQDLGSVCQKLIVYLDSPADKLTKIPAMKPLAREYFESNTYYLNKDDQKINEIPSWIKSITKLWAKDHKHNDFLTIVRYMINEEIIIVPEDSKSVHQNDKGNAPVWIKYNAKWWTENLISDTEFVNGIQYLVSNRIMVI